MLVQRRCLPAGRFPFGGPWRTGAAPASRLLLTSGPHRHWRDGRVQANRLDPRRVSAGSGGFAAAPQPVGDAGAAQLGGQTQTRPLVVHWTLQQSRSFLDAVSSVGGPHSASSAVVHQRVQEDGLSYSQVNSGLLKLRREADKEAATAGNPLPVRTALSSKSFRWTADGCARCDAAIAAQGGLQFAKAQRTHDIMGDAGLNLTQVKNRLVKLRRDEASGGTGAGGGGSGAGGDGAGEDDGSVGPATAAEGQGLAFAAGWAPAQQVILAPPGALDGTFASRTTLLPPSGAERVVLLAPLPSPVLAPMLTPAPALGPALAAPPPPGPAPMPSPALAQAPTLLPASAAQATAPVPVAEPAPSLAPASVADVMAQFSAQAAVNASLQSDISELSSSLRVFAQQQQPQPSAQPAPALSAAVAASTSQPAAPPVLAVAQQRAANLAAVGAAVRELRAQDAHRRVSDAEADAAFEVAHDEAKAARGAERLQQAKASRQSDQATILAVMAAAPHQPPGGLQGDAWAQMCQLLGEEAALSL